MKACTLQRHQATGGCTELRCPCSRDPPFAVGPACRASRGQTAPWPAQRRWRTAQTPTGPSPAPMPTQGKVWNHNHQGRACGTHLAKALQVRRLQLYCKAAPGALAAWSHEDAGYGANCGAKTRADPTFVSVLPHWRSGLCASSSPSRNTCRPDTRNPTDCCVVSPSLKPLRVRYFSLLEGGWQARQLISTVS